MSKILKVSVILGGFSFAADVVALFRDRILASNFGATRMLDIYYSAFKIPDLVFNLLVLGAVSSAFIPVFVAKRRENEADAWGIARNFTTAVFILVVLAAGIMFILAGPLMRLVAPGFIGADHDLAVSLTRWMLLSPILFSISTIFGSVLQSLERFWAYAIAPVLYNAGIIVGALWIAPRTAARGYFPVYGLAIGVILGAALHLALQAAAAHRAGFRYRPSLNLANVELRRIFKLMVPRTIGLGAYSLDSAIVNSFASTLAAGSITVLNVANNLQFVPIAVVGVSVATAVFPKLSHHASGQELAEFRRKLAGAVRNTAAVVIPVSIAGYFLAQWGINLFFGTGLFEGLSAARTAAVLQIFLWGVPAQSLIPIFSRAFYALQNTLTPVVISVCAIVTNVTLAWLLGLHLDLGVKGLALAFSVAGNIQILLLWLAFWHIYKNQLT
ncbi:MAG TPA: murein biosynthesis integral membrane protein MurJ [Candidatus Paceibacterota bacterium]|nr:murein biosynthesis integral membrane protein MurJ [Candidatus Paceibacterota bacterium]